MKALITGASGFAGRHLTRHLAEQGDEVVGIDRDDCDILDAGAVRSIVTDCAPEAVYHLAALAHVGDSWEAPNAVLRVNAEGTLNVLNAVASLTQRPRVLVIGSSEEYGAVEVSATPIGEDAPLRPTTPYGASKVAASALALRAWLGEGIEVIRTRSFNHTGAGQAPSYMASGFAARVAQAERDGSTELRTGSLDPVRDISDVRDVVRAYRLLVEHGTPGEIYNVCRGEGVSVREVGERLVARASRPLRLVVDPALVRPIDIPVMVGDRAKLTEATGWEPEWSLDDTLEALLADARARLT